MKVIYQKVNFRQEKRMVLNIFIFQKQARELLRRKTRPQERVFKGLKYGMTYNTEIIRWCNRAAVPKHITFPQLDIRMQFCC